MVDLNQDLNTILPPANSRADFYIRNPINAWAGAGSEIFVECRYNSQGLLVQEGWSAGSPQTVMTRTRAADGTFPAWAAASGGGGGTSNDDGSGYVSNNVTYLDKLALAGDSTWVKLDVNTSAGTALGQSVVSKSGTDLLAGASVQHAFDLSVTTTKASAQGDLAFGYQINSGPIVEVGKFNVSVSAATEGSMRWYLAASATDTIKVYVSNRSTFVMDLTLIKARLIRVKGL